jgi:hypothetical protein
MLLMCLNVGVKPPDALCIESEAKLEAWIDPLTAAKYICRFFFFVVGLL